MLDCDLTSWIAIEILLGGYWLGKAKILFLSLFSGFLNILLSFECSAFFRIRWNTG
jgi:hypothetical protein